MSNHETTLTEENVIEQFLKFFPELQKKAEEEKKWWLPEPEEDEEPHKLPVIFFGNVTHWKTYSS
jgi:hypothetical protein